MPKEPTCRGSALQQLCLVDVPCRCMHDTRRVQPPRRRLRWRPLHLRPQLRRSVSQVMTDLAIYAWGRQCMGCLQRGHHARMAPVIAASSAPSIRTVARAAVPCHAAHTALPCHAHHRSYIYDWVAPAIYMPLPCTCTAGATCQICNTNFYNWPTCLYCTPEITCRYDAHMGGDSAARHRALDGGDAQGTASCMGDTRMLCMCAHAWASAVVTCCSCTIYTKMCTGSAGTVSPPAPPCTRSLARPKSGQHLHIMAMRRRSNGHSVLRCAAHCRCRRGRGACRSADGACACFAGYAGNTCQFSDVETCSGLGTADALGRCTCKAGYAGPSCQVGHRHWHRHRRR